MMTIFASLSRRLPLLVAMLVTAPATAQLPPRGSYAFIDVDVVPMDAERVIENQTVVIESGRITAIGSRDAIRVPSGATRIEAQGKYLMPGIAEMHGHIPFSNANGAAEDVLFLYVAVGATTVRGMQGHPSQIALRRRVEGGEIIGPQLWLAAPSLSGNNVPDAATAVRLVREAKADGFDLLKVHEGLSAEAYDAIVATATEVGLPWGGHVSEHVGVSGALAAGQSTIDHLDDYIEAMQPADSSALAATGNERQRLLPLHADASTIPALARATREAGVAVVPTQMLWEVLRGARDPAPLAARPENRYMPPETVETWVAAATRAYAGSSREAAARLAALRQQLLKALSDAGVRILMGTDAPQVFSVPGFSLYHELELMAESGMTPYEVLRTGTFNVAAFFGVDDEAGTIAVGHRADLLLLDANPLEEVGAIRRNAGVMVDGRFLSRALIDERLAAIAARHAN